MSSYVSATRQCSCWSRSLLYSKPKDVACGLPSCSRGEGDARFVQLIIPRGSRQALSVRLWTAAARLYDVFDGLSQRNGLSWNAMLVVYVEQGRAEQALHIYRQMLKDGVPSDVRTFVSALQACCMLAESGRNVILDGISMKVEGLHMSMTIHADAWIQGFDSHHIVGSTLISTYGKCGSLARAKAVFHRLSHRNVVSWNAMLAAYIEHGEAENVLQMYEEMQVEGMVPDNRTFVTTLQACGMLAEMKKDVMGNDQSTMWNLLEKGKIIHAHAQHKGYESDVFLANTLISIYGKCGSSADARTVFDGLPHRDLVSWNALLAAYVEQGQAKDAMYFFMRMQEVGVSPDVRTFVAATQACGLLADDEVDVMVDGVSIKPNALELGKAMHSISRRRGYDSNVFVVSTLVRMYGKCGSGRDAQNVFDSLSQRNVVAWTTMIAVWVEQGEAEKAVRLYERMQEEGLSPNSRTFVSTLQACGILAEKGQDVAVGRSTKVKSLKRAKAIHADARKKGYDTDVFVGNTLITIYGKCDSIADAQIVFDGMRCRTVVSWNAILAAYVEHGQGEKALQLYERMVVTGVIPDTRTFVAALQACGMLAETNDNMVDWQSIKAKALAKGRKIHADVRRKGCDSDRFVSNTLVSMYGKCGSTNDAQVVFDGLSQRDVVSWNAMLTAYVEQSEAERALQLYRQMQQEGVIADIRTFVSAIQACGILAEKEVVVLMDGQAAKAGALQTGREIHSDARIKGYDSNVFVGSILISMYGKCGSIVDAQAVFDGISQRDMACWNAMLCAFVEQGHAEKTLQLYRQMELEGLPPNEITLLCILQACSKTGSLTGLRQIHHSLIPTAEGLSSFVASLLISAYGRCASMTDAQSLFDALRQPDRVSWNALIAAYAREGSCAASLQYYEKMLLAGVKPDGVTFLSLISACSHAGLVENGLEYFQSMSGDYGVKPDIEHYVSMIDLLGRAGYFSRVEDLLSTMPMQPNLTTWMCLLGACRKHGKVEIGKRAFDHAVDLQPKHAAAYVLMSNIYADAGLWDLAKEVKELEEKALAWKKPPGQSWIQHEQTVQAFLVGERNHREQVYDMLRSVSSELEDRNLQVRAP